MRKIDDHYFPCGESMESELIIAKSKMVAPSLSEKMKPGQE